MKKRITKKEKRRKLRKMPSREQLLAALNRAKNNKSKVGRRYGVHPSTVTRWMAYYATVRPDMVVEGDAAHAEDAAYPGEATPAPANVDRVSEPTATSAETDEHAAAPGDVPAVPHGDAQTPSSEATLEADPQSKSPAEFMDGPMSADDENAVPHGDVPAVPHGNAGDCGPVV